MAYANSGAKVTSSLLNGVFPAILSLFAQQAFNGTGGTFTSATYIVPPSGTCAVTMTSTGTFALVLFDALVSSGTSGQNARGSIAVSGATTTTALTVEGLQAFLQNSNTVAEKSMSCALLAITPGSNTYTMQYRNSTGGAMTVANQHMVVLAP